MKKLSSPAIEREFFSVASPESILAYLDNTASSSLAEAGGPWGPNYELPESSVQVLIKRNNRTIDAGLLRVLKSEYIDFLLERNGVEKNASNVEDFDMFTVALSGLGLYQFYDPPYWLAERLVALLENGSDEQLKTLFENPFLQPSLLIKIINKSEWAEKLLPERFIEVVYHALGSKLISKIPRDDHDYDSTQHDIIQSCWNLLLVLEPTQRNAAYLAPHFESFQEIELPYCWRESLNISVDDDEKDWEAKRTKEIKEFLKIIFDKWSPDSEGESSSDDRYFLFIQEYTVRKIPSIYLNNLREFLLSYDSSPITKGYFASLGIYQYDTSLFGSDLLKYKKDFLLGLCENPASFHIYNGKFGSLVRDAVESFEEEDGVEWFDTIKKRYYGMHERFKEKYPSVIIDDVDNFSVDE